MRLITRVSTAIVLFLVIVLAAIVPLGSHPNASSGGRLYGADQAVAQTRNSVQGDSTGQSANISDEYAKQKIAQTFGPDVAALASLRVSRTVPADDGIAYTEQYSNHWCGYHNEDPSANSVRATMNVCQTSTSNAHTISWVGVGNSNNGLIQAGYCMVKGSEFKCWYEMLPAGAVYISNLTIHIDDELGITVQRDWNYGANWYFVCIFNETTGAYFAQTFNYTPSPMGVDWIVETLPSHRIGTWNWPQGFWDAYWWDAGNPYVTHGITDAYFWGHVKMNTGAPYNEHATAYYDGTTGFHVQKTSS